MKKLTWVLGLLTAGVLALSGAGCKKQAASQNPQTLQDGVAQLSASLATASPEVRSNLYSGVAFGIRYGKYVDAMMALDQIASNPSLNEQQKKLVNNVLDLLKQEIQKQQGGASPAPR
ncbi:MAG TPA: hypothetical protein VN578_12000 [Candidatus Binatia bacterium]|nr:hypothetical protein [Candidatus Binatia bacterium]